MHGQRLRWRYGVATVDCIALTHSTFYSIGSKCIVDTIVEGGVIHGNLVVLSHMFVVRLHGLLNQILARCHVTDHPLIGGLLHVVVLSIVEVLQKDLLLWLDLVV